MSSSPYKNGETLGRKTGVKRPNARQTAIQLGLVALVVVIWGALLAGFLALAGNQEREAISEATPVPAMATMGTNEPAPTPTYTPTSVPTEAPDPTATSVDTATPATEASPSPAPTEEPPTAPPEPSPTTEPTATPAPPPTEPPAPTDAPASISFAQDVLPILENRCLRCHSGSQADGALELDSYQALMAGGEGGPAVVPFDADNSELVRQIVLGKMPRRAPKLLPDQIQAITDWVNAGALDN